MGASEPSSEKVHTRTQDHKRSLYRQEVYCYPRTSTWLTPKHIVIMTWDLYNYFSMIQVLILSFESWTSPQALSKTHPNPPHSPLRQRVPYLQSVLPTKNRVLRDSRHVSLQALHPLGDEVPAAAARPLRWGQRRWKHPRDCFEAPVQPAEIAKPK